LKSKKKKKEANAKNPYKREATERQRPTYREKGTSPIACFVRSRKGGVLVGTGRGGKLVFERKKGY